MLESIDKYRPIGSKAVSKLKYLAQILVYHAFLNFWIPGSSKPDLIGGIVKQIHSEKIHYTLFFILGWNNKMQHLGEEGSLDDLHFFILTLNLTNDQTIGPQYVIYDDMDS